MSDNLDNLRLPPRTNFAVETLNQVDAAAKQLPAPALVADAVVPEVGTGKGRPWIGGVTHEAAGSVGVHAEQEGNEEVMRIPKRLVRLLANLVVSGRVHEQHAEKHDVPGNAAGLAVVNLHGPFRPYLRLFDIEEAVKVVSKRRVE